MPFSVGEVVVVRLFGNKRGEVVAIGRDGRRQVRVESITMWCEEKDLAPPVESKKRQKATRAEPRAAEEKAERPGRVDLHGLIVEDAIARMVEEIDRSLRRGADRVEVVHGKGSGRVRDAVHRHLATMPVVAAFRLDPKNSGVTWAHFR